MRKLKTCRLAALTIAALATFVPFARADVLEQFPSDTLVAVKVANLAATSKKVGQLANDFAIANFVPQMQDPLASLKQKLGIQKGLKEDGEFGFAFLSPKATGLSGDHSIVILVPVSNYGDFIGNFEGAKADGDITEVDFPGNPGRDAPRFVANWGAYAAMSPSKELLAKPADTLKLSALPTKEAARQDFVLYANFAKITPEVMPEFDKFVDKAMGEIDKENKEIDAKYKPLLKTTLKQFVWLAKSFLNDSDGATVGLNINEQGMNFTLLSAFKPDSYLGKFAADFKGTDKPLTVGLPAGKYLFFGGSEYTAGASAKVIDDLVDPILDELKKIEGMEGVGKLADTMRAAIKANTGFTIGMPAPTEPGKEAVLQQITVYHGGGKEMKQLSTEGVAVLKTFLADLKVPEGKKKPECTQTLNSKQIEGVTFDTLKFDFPASPDDPMAAQAEQMLAIFYGPEGIAYNTAPLGDKDFILTVGAPDATIGKFIKASQAKEDSLSKLEHVKVVTDQLPKTRVVEYYVALDEMVNTGIATAGQFGLPVQVQLPPELPPIGATMGTDGTSIRVDVHVPSSTVQAIIAAGMQAFMQMQRGGGGGNL